MNCCPRLCKTLILVLASAVLACTERSTGITVGSVPVASVTVAPSSAIITVGQTLQLTATPKNASGNPLTGVVTWVSSAPAVATVDASGLVTGVGAGPATITATSEGKSGS